MGAVIFIALAVIAVWAGSLYLWPFGPYLRCNGTGRNSGSTGKRYGECQRCKGSGRRRRADARTVHRGAVSLADKARVLKGTK